MDRSLHGARKMAQGAFTNAVKTFVGLQPQEQPVLPGIAHQIRPDVFDFHKAQPTVIFTSRSGERILYAIRAWRVKQNLAELGMRNTFRIWRRLSAGT